jgi:hypothetical protein
VSDTIRVNGEDWIRAAWYYQRGEELVQIFDERIALSKIITDTQIAIGEVGQPVESLPESAKALYRRANKGEF